MERRSFVQGAGLAGVLAAGVAPAVVHAQANLRWRLTSSFPKVLDTLFGVNDIFAAKVRELSGGRFQITTHAPGELVPAFGTIDAVKDGTVEMANTAPYYYFGKDETFALACAIPFGLNSRQMTAWYYEGNGLKLLRDFYRQYNIVNFPMGNTGAQMGGWFRKPIGSLADFKGTNSGSEALVDASSSALAVCPRTFRVVRSTRRWRKAPSTPPNGWDRMTT
jgi:TRAP-type mannitol/chloroaromatic compound transport system substrate-binding protein